MPSASTEGRAAITVHLDQRSPLRRIWRYVGYDEPNYTYTPNGHALLAKLARAARISVCVDHPDNLAAISAVMVAAQAEVEVLIEVDVGQGRCGVSDPGLVLTLARQIGQLPGPTWRISGCIGQV